MPFSFRLGPWWAMLGILAITEQQVAAFEHSPTAPFGSRGHDHTGQPPLTPTRTTIWGHDGDSLKLMLSRDGNVGMSGIPDVGISKGPGTLPPEAVQVARRMIAEDRLGTQLADLNQRFRDSTMKSGRKLRIAPPDAQELPYDSVRKASGFTVRRMLGNTRRISTSFVEAEGKPTMITTILSERRGDEWYMNGIVYRQFQIGEPEKIMVMEYPGGRRIAAPGPK